MNGKLIKQVGILKSRILKVNNFFDDLLFPINCINCGKEGLFLCKKCQILIRPNLQFQCPVCKKIKESVRVCDDCHGQSHLEGLFVLTDYNNQLIQRIIHSIKYNFVVDLSYIFDDLIVDYFGSNADWNKCFNVLPVPLAKRKFLFRGFNQAELISKVIGKQLGNQISPPFLKRVRNTKAQAKLTAEERRKNIRGAFDIDDKLAKRVSKKNIVLVDDVYTTGSTMQECAKVLSKNGFKNIWGLVIARG